MKIEVILIICSLLLNLYVLIWFIKELIILVKNYFKKIYVAWSKNHSIEHIEYVSIYILFIIAFFLWLFWIKGIEYWINTMLIDEYLFIILFIMWISNNILLKHIKREREDTQ